ACAAEDVNRLLQRERDAFHDGADKMIPRMRSVHADKAAANLRVGMRRALSNQIRREQQSAGARLHVACACHHFVEALALSERLLEPAQAVSCSKRNAHRVEG